MSDPPALPVLEGTRVRLRTLIETDAAGLHEAYGDPQAMRFWDSLPSRDVAETAERIRRSFEGAPQWRAAFAVERSSDAQFVGMVNYHARQAWNRRLAVGYIMVPRFWRQGLMRDAVQTLLMHCFEQLDTHRVELEIEPDNTASIRLAERLGFQREALLRDRLFVDGTPRSVLMYALLRPEWQATE